MKLSVVLVTIVFIVAGACKQPDSLPNLLIGNWQLEADTDASGNWQSTSYAYIVQIAANGTIAYTDTTGTALVQCCAPNQYTVSTVSNKTVEFTAWVVCANAFCRNWPEQWSIQKLDKQTLEVESAENRKQRYRRVN